MFFFLCQCFECFLQILVGTERTTGNELCTLYNQSYQELLICQSHRYILSLPLKLHVQRSDVFPHLPPIRPAQVASVFVVDTPRILLLPIIQAGFLDVPRVCHVPRMACHPGGICEILRHFSGGFVVV